MFAASRASLHADSCRAAAPLVLLLAALLPGCPGDGTAVEQCREIQSLRCDLSPVCTGDSSEDAVESCKIFYRDQCLHGVENVEAAPSGTEQEACLGALRAVAACVSAGTSPADCNVDLIAGDPPALCEVLVGSRVAALSACAFAALPIEKPAASDGGGGASPTAGGGGIGN